MADWKDDEAVKKENVDLKIVKENLQKRIEALEAINKELNYKYINLKEAARK